MSSNRRQHTRSLKALEFTCYIDGQRFDARSIDVSAGGAFMDTDALVPVGSVALIALKKGQQTEEEERSRRSRKHEFPIVLLGLVVRQQTTPSTGVGLQWLRCVSRVGIQPMYDFLGFVLDLFPSSLPLPSSAVATLDFMEFDFVLQEFRPGRSEDRSWSSQRVQSPKSGTTRRRTPLQGTSHADEVLAAAGLKQEPVTEETPAPKPVQKKPAPQEPDFTMQTLESTPNGSPSAKGELARLLEGSTELIYRPTTVEVLVGGTRIRGVVHSLGRQQLLMATPGKEVVAGTRLTVRFPVPLKGRKVMLDLLCDVGAASPMEGRDAVSYDLTIRGVEKEPAPGLWQRWVQYLLEKRAFIS